jgi:PAS domain S-box-containing protein
MNSKRGDRTASAQARPTATAHSDGAERLFGPLAMALLEEGPAICVNDASGRRLFANKPYERIAAALATSADGDSTQPSWPFQQPTRGTGETASPSDHDAGADEACAITIDDRIEYYRIRRKALLGEDGRAPVIATVYVPVSGHAAAGDALTMAIERLEDVTRLVSDWVWETDRNLVLTFVSPRVNGALGFHQVELTGRRLTQLPARPHADLEALATEEGRVPFRDIEVVIPDRQGNPRHFLLSGLPIYCPVSGRFLGYRGTANDITELRWREEALVRTKEAAELANRTKGEFLANMSHELRTPLNAIIGFSEVMANEILGPLDNEQYKGYCKDITDSARHLLVLINDILDSAKIESGQMTLSEEAIDAEALAQSVARLMAPRAERAGVTVTVHAAPNLPRLRADKTKLKQILINLVSNAVKFTLPGGRVDVFARIGEDDAFILEVSDTGIGIAAKDIARALAPFGQVDARMSRRFEGTGLGLPLAKSLTELHGGAFELTSEPDVGTRVTIRLPGERSLPA